MTLHPSSASSIGWSEQDGARGVIRLGYCKSHSLYSLFSNTTWSCEGCAFKVISSAVFPLCFGFLFAASRFPPSAWNVIHICHIVFFFSAKCDRRFLFWQVETSLAWQRQDLEKLGLLLCPSFKHCWRPLNVSLLWYSHPPGNLPFRSRNNLRLLDLPLVSRAVSGFCGIVYVKQKTE